MHSARAAQAPQSVRLNTAWMRGAPTSPVPARQVDLCFALRAADLLVFPVDVEVALLVGPLCLGPPPRHAPDRPFERDAVILSAVDQQGRVDVG